MDDCKHVEVPVQTAKCVIQVKNFMGAIEFEIRKEFSPPGSNDLWCFYIKKEITEFIDHRDFRKNYLVTKIGLRLCSTGHQIAPGSTYNFSFHFKLGDKKEDHMTMYEPLHVSEEIKWTLINMGTEYPLPTADINPNLTLAAHRVFLTPEESKYALEDAIFTCVAFYTPTDAEEKIAGKAPPRPPPPSVYDDLKKMFDSLDLLDGDVELIASNGKIATHKLLLSCRSDVFKRMFSIDSAERRTGRVELTDFTIETLEEFVYFLTKDVVRKIEEKAIDLFVLSDKYNVESLRLLTEDYLSHNISKVNAYRLHDVCLKIKSDPIARSLIEFFDKTPSPDGDDHN